VPTPLTESQRHRIDRFGYLYARKQARAHEEKEFEALRKEIIDWYPTLGNDQTELAEGFEYQIQISEKSIVKRWLSMTALTRAVGGYHKLTAICIVTFKAVADLIGNAAAEELQGESQTGWRKLKAVPIIAVPCERVQPKKAA
jgi:hypothetical protein